MEILSANHGQTLQNPPIISLLEKRKDHVHEHHNVPLTLAARFSRGRWLNLAKRHRERADIPCNFKPAVFMHFHFAADIEFRGGEDRDNPTLGDGCWQPAF